MTKTNGRWEGKTKMTENRLAEGKGREGEGEARRNPARWGLASQQQCADDSSPFSDLPRDDLYHRRGRGGGNGRAKRTPPTDCQRLRFALLLYCIVMRAEERRTVRLNYYIATSKLL